MPRKWELRGREDGVYTYIYELQAGCSSFCGQGACSNGKGAPIKQF